MTIIFRKRKIKNIRGLYIGFVKTGVKIDFFKYCIYFVKGFHNKFLVIDA